MLRTKREFLMDQVCETSLGKENRREAVEIMPTTIVKGRAKSLRGDQDTTKSHQTSEESYTMTET